jgi:hypothetical protein
VAEPIDATSIYGLTISIGRAFMRRPEMRVADLYTVCFVGEAEGLELSEYAEREGLSKGVMSLHVRETVNLGLAIVRENRVFLTEAGKGLVDEMLRRP